MIQAFMLGVRKESRCSASQVYALQSILLQNLGPAEVSTKANGCLSFPKHFLFCENCSIPLQLNYFHTTCFVDYDFVSLDKHLAVYCYFCIQLLT